MPGGAVDLMMELVEMIDSEKDSSSYATAITCLSAIGTVTLGIGKDFNGRNAPFVALRLDDTTDYGDGFECNHTRIGKPGDSHWELLRKMLVDLTTGPIHKHDCDQCEYLYSAPRKNGGGWCDIYLSCEHSDYRYIVRYGRQGAYATSNDVSRYCLSPLIGPSVSEYALERDRPLRKPLPDPSDVPGMLDEDIFTFGKE